MSSDDHIKLLSMVDVLEPLSWEELVDLHRRTPVIDLEPHQILYSPGYRGDMVFFLLTGRVRVYKGVAGREFTLDVIEPGTMFGGTALGVQYQNMYESPFAETMEPSSIGLMRREAFERLVISNPEVGLKALQLIGGRLHDISTRIADIALKEVPARLASMILYMIEHEGRKTSEDIIIPIHHTHRQLGARIGADRVAVTRAFTKLQETGAVVLAKRQIHVKDVEALKKIARER